MQVQKKYPHRVQKTHKQVPHIFCDPRSKKKFSFGPKKHVHVQKKGAQVQKTCIQLYIYIILRWTDSANNPWHKTNHRTTSASCACRGRLATTHRAQRNSWSNPGLPLPVENRSGLVEKGRTNTNLSQKKTRKIAWTIAGWCWLVVFTCFYLPPKFPKMFVIPTNHFISPFYKVNGLVGQHVLYWSWCLDKNPQHPKLWLKVNTMWRPQPHRIPQVFFFQERLERSCSMTLPHGIPAWNISYEHLKNILNSINWGCSTGTVKRQTHA